MLRACNQTSAKFIFTLVLVFAFAASARADLFTPKNSEIKDTLIRLKLTGKKAVLRYNRVAKILGTEYSLVRVWDEDQPAELPWRVAYDDKKSSVYVFGGDAVQSFNVVTLADQSPLGTGEEAIKRSLHFSALAQAVEGIYVDRDYEPDLFKNYNIVPLADQRLLKPQAAQEADEFRVIYYVSLRPKQKIAKNTLVFSIDGHLKRFDTAIVDKPPE